MNRIQTATTTKAQEEVDAGMILTQPLWIEANKCVNQPIKRSVSDYGADNTILVVTSSGVSQSKIF